MGLQTLVLQARIESELESALSGLARSSADGLVITADPFFTSRSVQLARLTVQYRLPAIFRFREFVESGGLMSYGSSLSDAYRLAGTYAARILKGEKPAELPVQQSSKIDLFINLKTAKALGLTVSPALLARADEVIE
jgi:putative ABC transport system substrate-binding protein